MYDADHFSLYLAAICITQLGTVHDLRERHDRAASSPDRLRRRGTVSQPSHASFVKSGFSPMRIDSGSLSLREAVPFNGGHPTFRDANEDKAVTGRIGYEPFSWLRASISASRSGDLDVNGDRISAQYFGNGFFFPLGEGETTDSFNVGLLQADVELSWRSGRLWGGGGYIDFEESGPEAVKDHTGSYFQLGMVQTIYGDLYGAGRFSQIFANDGFAIVGQGSIENFKESELTDNLWRLSLGLGYRLNAHVVLKAEFSMERGEDILGNDLKDRDMIGLQLAFGF